MRRPWVLLSVLIVSVLLISGCGGVKTATASGPGATPTPTPGASPTPTPTTSIPAVDHVFFVVLENHGFDQVIGSPSMPYLNSLATQHSLATNFFSNTHPSIGNYFMLTVGEIETNDDAFAGTITDDNIVRSLLASGKTWKAYVQSLPSVGYLGNDVYPYFKHHDPFVYLSDVVNSSAQAQNVVPFSQLQSDVAAGTLPPLVYLSPDAENDAHDCPAPTGGSNCADSAKLVAADTWLKTNLDPLINNPALANSVFIIDWDEALDSDTAPGTTGGGHIPLVLVGAHVRSGFQSTTFYQHQSVLLLMTNLLQLNDHPGLSSSAPSMAEFFQ